jgi:hypothetical protein
MAVSGQRHAPAALYLRKRPPVPIVQEAGWAPELVWTQRLEEKSFRLCQGSNLDRPVVQPLARHYTDLDTWLTTTTTTTTTDDDNNNNSNNTNTMEQGTSLRAKGTSR